MDPPLLRQDRGRVSLWIGVAHYLGKHCCRQRHAGDSLFNPTVVAGGSIIGNAGTFPIQRYQTDHQLVYNITTLFGNHYFKAGTDIRRQRLHDLADSFSRGFYNFTTAFCNGINYVSGFNALINGCVSNFQKGYGPFFLENRINEYNFYGEDNWKVRPNLTLNIGFRYEYVAVPHEAKNRLDYLYQDDKDNVEPRVGFAWSPEFRSGFGERLFGEPGNSSIRGGYGYLPRERLQSVFSQGGAGLRFNPPNALTYSQTATTTALTIPLCSTQTIMPIQPDGFRFCPWSADPAGVTGNSADPGLEMPYTQQWNSIFERQYLSVPRYALATQAIAELACWFRAGNVRVLTLRRLSRTANHPNNAPTVLYTAAQRPAAGGREELMFVVTVLRLASNSLCAGTGLAGIAVILNVQ